MTTALLIIDIQHALCTGAEAAFDIDNVIENINRLSAKARAASVPVLLIQHEENEGDLQFDSSGWQLASMLVTHPADVRIRKTAPDSFHQTALDAWLKQHEATHLVICGLQTDCCIDATVRRALALGYDVTLAADAHSTVSNEMQTAAQIIADLNTALTRMTGLGHRITVTPASNAHGI
jgi:nicotinamidase-related amidase